MGCSSSLGASFAFEFPFEFIDSLLKLFHFLEAYPIETSSPSNPVPF